MKLWCLQQVLCALTNGTLVISGISGQFVCAGEVLIHFIYRRLFLFWGFQNLLTAGETMSELNDDPALLWSFSQIYIHILSIVILQLELQPT